MDFFKVKASIFFGHEVTGWRQSRNILWSKKPTNT